MSVPPNSRREFLGLTSAGIAAAALGLATHAASAQTNSNGAQMSLTDQTKPELAKAAQTAGVNRVAGFYDVKAFGATGDGKTLDTPAINSAIQAAAAAGGGTVYFAAGTYLSFSIHLKGNVGLYLDHGAVILAADSPTVAEGNAGYDPAEPNQWDKYQDFGHSHWHNSLIWGEGIENVSILGPGLMWGKGLTRGAKAEQPGVGNKSISLKNCCNVILRDFSIFHGGHFGILATGVENLTIDNLTIDTNRDGIDIDCCRNVRVSNCSVNSPWDDAICLKSSYGLGYAKPTEMVTIANCLVTGGYEEGTLLDGTFKPLANVKVSRTGRIKFGTESNGGFKNITISNCVFDNCQGLALETVDGGLLEDVTISNITMRDIVSAPIFLRLGSRMRGPQGAAVGSLRRVTISNIVCSNSASNLAVIISGIPGHYIEDVKLSDIYIQYQGGGSKADAAIEPDEKENAYPEPRMFGQMPAYGCFIRHAQAIELSNVKLTYLKEDLRPAFILSDVKDADFFRVKAQHAQDVPSFVLKRVEDFSIHQSRPVADVVLARVEHKAL